MRETYLAMVSRAKLQSKLVMTTFEVARVVAETAAADVLNLRHEYESKVVDKTTCSEEHCEFWISVTEWKVLLSPSDRAWVETSREFLVKLLPPVGLRITTFDTYIRVEKGKLRKLDVRPHLRMPTLSPKACEGIGDPPS